MDTRDMDPILYSIILASYEIRIWSEREHNLVFEGISFKAIKLDSYWIQIDKSRSELIDYSP